MTSYLIFTFLSVVVILKSDTNNNNLLLLTQPALLLLAYISEFLGTQKLMYRK